MYQCYTDNVFLQQLNAPQVNGSPETPRVRFADDEVQAEAYTLRAASDAGAVKIVIDGAAFTREHGPSWALLSGVLFSRRAISNLFIHGSNTTTEYGHHFPSLALWLVSSKAPGLTRTYVESWLS